MKFLKTQTTTFEVERGGQTICGFECRPVGKTNLPIIIVSHGFMANFLTTIFYAEAFARLGFCAYSFDFIGGGFAIRSDGKLKDMTILSEKEDLKQVIAYATSRSYNNPDNLNLMGCSQGGLVSALTAAELGKDVIKKLILFYPALCVQDDAWSGKMIFFKFDPKKVPEKVGLGFMTVGGNYIKCAQNLDVYSEIAKYTGKVYIAHGTKDSIVDYQYGVKAYETYKAAGADVAFMCIPNAPHMFLGPPEWDAFFRAKEFLLKDKKLILDVDVTLTGVKAKFLSGLINVLDMPFDGESETSFFKGEVLPGAKDHQKYLGFIPYNMCADYTLSGKDSSGEECQIHVVNRFNLFKDLKWHPEVNTDSRELDFINHADCDALFGFKPPFKGPRIRIFAKTS